MYKRQVLIGWPDIARGDFRAVFVFCFALVFGVIGYLDDYEKVKKHENTGLTAGPKFLLQLAAAIAFTALLRHFGYLAPHLYIPFANVTVCLLYTSCRKIRWPKQFGKIVRKIWR